MLHHTIKVGSTVLMLVLVILILITSNALMETSMATRRFEENGVSTSQNSCRVQTRLLNGRAAPRKTASIEARFDYGDILEATGEWSKDYKWVEVAGGETGTVWVSIRFISERKHFMAVNQDYKEVKVRKWPVSGKVVKKLKRGQKVEIEQVVLGWGKTTYGWVDLYFLEEVQHGSA